MAGWPELAHPDRAGAQSAPIRSGSRTIINSTLPELRRSAALLQKEFFEESTHRVDTKQ